MSVFYELFVFEFSVKGKVDLINVVKRGNYNYQSENPNGIFDINIVTLKVSTRILHKSNKLINQNEC